ncbi:oligosaccharide flippase family protein [Natronogracilivirga saccharolytica]|uniref:Oligosaccharide flippase family protein n=1 Tax=Natronogracilivirga saccharolytica TaxID=2812953 RepID=A0A8J7UVG6_9BACT|nr:oligosaccharide flippase family protein [Natronogracilivirga saccharolytica]MBP3192526.1 oligosaccharide flippase family protein [Natronogracilivirga saccharolytica]
MKSVLVGITGPALLTVKARFLSPEEFGYIAVILIIVGLFRLMESFGISQAIIQRDEVTIQESSTLFYFNMLLSIFMAALLYFFSPLIASFFSLPILEEYLRVVCIIVLVTGPSLLFRAYLEKMMLFKFLSLIEIARALLNLGFTTFFLVLDWGVLGVIYAQILTATLTTLAITGVAIYLKAAAISFYFKASKLIPFLRFGVFVSAKQLMSFATKRLDEVLIGYFLTSEILGIYHFGKNMLEKFRSLMTQSFGKVLFPVLTKLKNQPPKLSFAYQRISRYIAFGAFPVFAGIAVTAHLFVPVLFGEQWNDSIIIFQVFSVAVSLLILTTAVSTSLLYAVNKPDQVFYLDAATNTIYFLTLLLFASEGMLAVLLAYSGYVIYKSVIFQIYANKQLTDSIFSYISAVSTPAASSCVMVIVVLVFQLISNMVLSSSIQLVGSITIGIMVYVSMIWFFAWETLLQIKTALTKGEIA